MSAATIANRIQSGISSRDYRLAHPEILEHLFGGFEAGLLLKADDMASGQVTGICARAAVEAAERRLTKLRNSPERSVLFTDFIPAFEYISDLAIPKNRFRFPKADVAVFTAEVSQLIRQCCPWC